MVMSISIGGALCSKIMELLDLYNRQVYVLWHSLWLMVYGEGGSLSDTQGSIGSNTLGFETVMISLCMI